MKRAHSLPLLCLLLTPCAALGQDTGTGRIQGTVTIGSTGQPLAGANVTVPGTRLGVLAAASGRFVLTGVPAGQQTVQAALIGYTTQTRAVTVTAGAAARADFQLEVEAVQLAGIVAVGYGTQSRRTLTGSVAQIRARDIAQLTTANPLDALRGRLPGVDVIALTNDPGGAVRVRIQGARSIQASNDPLLVVNGVPTDGDLRDIALGDIQSIDVLKDAAATAVYGSRGANGVLLVTTKGGIAGRTLMEYSATFGVSDILRRLDRRNGQEYARYRREFGRAQPQGYPQCVDYIAHVAACDSVVLDSKERAGLAAGVSTDWQDLVLRRGALQNHQLSISGGDEHTRFRAALAYLDQNAITITQGYTGKNASLSAAHDFGRMEVRASVNASRLQRQVGAGAATWGLALGNSPLGRNKDDQGNYVFLPTEGGLLVNPVVNAQNVVDEVTRTSLLGSLESALELLPGLRLHVNFGPQYAHTGEGSFIGTFTSLNRGTAAPLAAHTNNTVNNYTFSTFLDLDARLGKTDRIQGTLLYELAGSRVEKDTAAASGLPYSTQLWYDLGSGNTQTIYSRLAESRLQSYMGRISYTRNNRYTATLSGRVDGSSVLAEGHKYAFFPGAALAWQLGDEPFVARLRPISDLKLRLSYGRVGNSAINPYQTLGTLQAFWYALGDAESYVLGYGPKGIPNPDLKWETTDKYNIGIDFGLLDNRVTGSLDGYQERTHDLLLLRALPYSTGYANVLANVGATRNAGFEALLTTRNLDNWHGLSWSTDLSFSRNRNRIVSLADGMLADVGNRRWVGQTIDVNYDYRFIGIWQRADSALASQMGGFKPGDPRVADVNGDGKITVADRTFIGRHYNFPRWQGSLANRFVFRRFDASVLATARWGFTVPDGFVCGGSDYWTPENPSNDCPRPGSMASLGQALLYRDGSYVRVRDITLGYSLPTPLAQRLGMQRTRAYVRAQDPFLFTKFVGWDPEAGFGTVTATEGPGSPAYRTLLFGVDVSF